MLEHLNSTLYTARRSAIREFSALAAQTPGCIRLTLGEPDFSTPEVICRAVEESFSHGDTHYIENNGSLLLRRAISGYESKTNGLDYSENEIIVTVGATEALFIALFGILNPGDEVIVPIPAFVLYEQIVNLCRGTFLPLDTVDTSFQIDRRSLEKIITPRTKAIVLNSPNNPTGCILNRRSLLSVFQAVCDREIFVICDDVYRQLVFDADYHSFAEYRELRDRILVVQSFSKPYAMTGWRMGYLMGDRPVMEKIALVHQFNVVSSAAPFQRACSAALQYDNTEMLSQYAARRRYVLERLRQMGLPVHTPQGAFYVFPSVKELSMDSMTFCRRLITEAGVAVTPGSAFGAEGFIRISYCCSIEDLKTGLDRLEGFLSDCR